MRHESDETMRNVRKAHQDFANNVRRRIRESKYYSKYSRSLLTVY
jgi:hypothetical protein